MRRRMCGEFKWDDRLLIKRSKIEQNEGSRYLIPQEKGNGSKDPKGLLREHQIIWYMAYSQDRRQFDKDIGGEDSL